MRLPSTYPNPALITYSNSRELQTYYQKANWEIPEYRYDPYVFCDGEDSSIHIESKLGRESGCDISWYLLHEIGHLLALQKYGEKDPRWNDFKLSEQYADNFANRWCKKLKEEGFFNKV